MSCFRIHVHLWAYALPDISKVRRVRINFYNVCSKVNIVLQQFLFFSVLFQYAHQNNYHHDTFRVRVQSWLGLGVGLGLGLVTCVSGSGANVLEPPKCLLGQDTRAENVCG